MATKEEIRKEADILVKKWQNGNPTHIASLSRDSIKKGIQIEREKPNKYKMFYDHIKAHLKPNQEVICKICGKSAKTIWDDE